VFNNIISGLTESLIMNVCLFIICTICFVVLITSILYTKFGYFKRFYHDVMKWHEPGDYLWWNGYIVHSYCKYCNKEILRDSQGNWF